MPQDQLFFSASKACFISRSLLSPMPPRLGALTDLNVIFGAALLLFTVIFYRCPGDLVRQC